MKYLIRIYHYGVVTREVAAATKQAAKAIYIREASVYSQYAQLVLDGKPLVTAQAERHFGIPGTAAQKVWTGKGG